RRLEQERGLPQAATLKELVAGIPQPEAGELEELKKSLADEAEKLTQLIKLNNLLTRNALEFNARLLRVIVRGPQHTYLQNGTMEDSSNLALLINRSV
ncbi:MAG: flagellar export chaperone FlgN, partial [Moorella sp. (in: Bacteria)]|nr:flagellar export chaperone FlgN [Moorella sp. (in: firmicutes)]